MQQTFLINGGKPLRGEIEVRGSKNAALPILAATLLTDKPCVIKNLPLIEDVFKMLEILKRMGAEVSMEGEREVRITSKNIDPAKIPHDIIGWFRGSILILGPLLARFGLMSMPSPGGCVIGARPIDTHLDAFVQAGAKIISKGDLFNFRITNEFRKPSVIILKEFSVTATENILSFLSLQNSKSRIKIADQDYQVQELVKVLNKMGAKIRIAGIHEFEISGSKKLGGFSYTIISDPVEGGTFVIAALATKGRVTVKNAGIQFLDLFLKRLKDFGAHLEIEGDSVHVFPSSRLKMDKVQSLPYPGIHSDLQPQLGVLATQSRGSTLIHDPLYEGRLKYLEELNKMGADIIFCDPHRAVVNGPTPLYGVEIPSLDLRAGAALIIAGLLARGVTSINNAYQVDRGYEKIEERLVKLGADIKRIAK